MAVVMKIASGFLLLCVCGAARMRAEPLDSESYCCYPDVSYDTA